MRNLRLLIMFMLTATFSWAQNYIGAEDGVLYQSYDGGLTWGPVNFGGTNDVRSVTKGPDGRVFAGTHGQSSGNRSNNYLGSSADSGQTWVSHPTGLHPRSTIGEINFFPSSSNATGMINADLVGGNSIEASLSVDSGQTWAGNSNGIANTIAAMPFNETSAWLATKTGIYTTSNNGSSYQSQFSLPAYRGAGRIGNDTIIIVGDDGNANISVDNGTTWSELILPGLTTQDLYDVTVSNDHMTVIIVGNSGFAVISADAGQSWNTLSLGSRRLLETVMKDDSTIFIYGDDYDGGSTHNLWISIDGGTSFNAILSDSVAKNPDNRYRFQSMKFLNDSVGFLAHNRGCTSICYDLLYTMNGGRSWLTYGSSKPHADVITEFFPISMDTVVACGSRSSGKRWYTTDMGASWSDLGASAGTVYDSYSSNDTIFTLPVKASILPWTWVETSCKQHLISQALNSMQSLLVYM